MKTLYRACVRLMTLAIPVVIAACYGPPARFSKSGHVIDQQTHATVANAQVDCVDSKGTVLSEATTLADGSFELYYDTTCDHLQVSVPASDGGPSYQPATVPFDSSDNVTIELDEST